MIDIVKLTWKQCRRRASILSEGLGRTYPGRTKLFGVPRGGAIAAGLVQMESSYHYDIVANVEQADIVIDDIIDSGRTCQTYQQKRNIPFVALVNKQGEDKALGWVEFPWEGTSKLDAESIVTRTLEFIGEDPKRDGLRDTPRRVVNSWADLFGGYRLDPAAILSTSFQERCDQMVMLDNIEFYSMCEHHMLPFYGKAHIAYLPGERIVGISKLARLVDCFAHRLQIQERLTQQIAEMIDLHLKPLGVGVMVEAKHFCMICRGVRKQNSIMRTSALRGKFLSEPQVRQEFFSLIGR